MPVIHIVLVKLKAEVQSGAAFEQFVSECNALGDHAEIQPLVKEMKWGKPLYDIRSQGYNWGEKSLPSIGRTPVLTVFLPPYLGLYSVFEDKAKLEEYRDHPVHRAFVAESIGKYTEGLLAYDFDV